MAARNRWQVCLWDEEDKQARAILTQYSLSASELLRECFAFTVEHTPDFRVMRLQIERTGLEKRLKANLDELEMLTKGTPLAEIPPIELPNRRPRTRNSVGNDADKTSPKASFTDKRLGQTEEERFLRAALYVANGHDVVTPEIKTRVLDQARKHSEWLAKVQEPERNTLEAMLRIPRIGGRKE
jgi:hypothetical protein